MDFQYSSAESNDPEQHLGALTPELSKLADWLDRKHFPISATGVRDWHVERDGPWRPYAAHLARALELKGTAFPAPLARSLLRSSRQRLTKFFRDAVL